MTPFVLASIVEGHGDVEAVRQLLLRLCPRCRIPRPIRVPRGRILTNDVFPRFLAMAAANIAEFGGHGAVLVIFDSDDDCAVELSGARREAARKSIGHIRCGCVLAVREFEAWLIAGDSEHVFDGDPEALRDPKGLLREWYGRYRETADQPRLTARMDVNRARQRSRSFRALESCLNRIVEQEHER